MVEISWSSLESRLGSPELSFESFNFLIARKSFLSYGSFEYDYNTPGSEFYLTLSSDCDELKAKKGEVIGWQAKFWFNHSDPNNSPLQINHRNELVKGFKKSLEYKPNLTSWIICTPGQFSNSQPHKVKDKLIAELKNIKPDIEIYFWNKPIYESFLTNKPDNFLPIFQYFFGDITFNFSFFENHLNGKLEILKKKYDADLYSPGEAHDSVLFSIDIGRSCKEIRKKILSIHENFESYLKTDFFLRPEYYFIDNNDVDVLKDSVNKYYLKFKNYAFRSSDFNTLEDLASICLDLAKFHDETILILRKLTFSRVDSPLKASGDNSYQWEHYLIKGFIKESKKTIEDVIDLLADFEDLVAVNLNIFGDPGRGKTNLACSVAEYCLKNSFPAIFVTGKEIISTDPIKRQILTRLDVSPSYTFANFLDILNSIGELKNIRVPIIIDSLNETTPNTGIWSTDYGDIVVEVSRYKHVVLITTCRSTYLKDIYGVDEITEVPNSLILEGFSGNNLGPPIQKYFDKYNITPLNDDYDKSIFKHPLLLRIFSEVNQGQSVVVNQQSIFSTFDRYIEKTISDISQANPVLKGKIIKALNELCLRLWSDGGRSVGYPDELLSIFDPRISASEWNSSTTKLMLDEGMLISREMQGNNEVAEFSYDLVAGYYIAKSVFFENEEFKENILQDENTLTKLTGNGDAQKRHPLSDDILRSLIYLIPHYMNKEIFEYTSNSEILRFNILESDQIVTDDERKTAFVEYFKEIGSANPNFNVLLKKMLLMPIERPKRGELFASSEILLSVLSRLTASEIDQHWSEAIRGNTDTVVGFLNYLEDNLEKELFPHDVLLRYITLIFSTTNRYLRDVATKLAVAIGLKIPDYLLNNTKLACNFADTYIVERAVASLCGVVLLSQDKDLAIKSAQFLETHFYKNLKTTHALILDSVHTVISYAESCFNYKRQCSIFDHKDLPEWLLDEGCTKEIKKDGDATWGYGPVDYEFSKYEIGSISKPGRYGSKSELPTLKESLAMIIWRMKQHGYSEEVFDKYDSDIIESPGHNYHSKSNSTERYGKKYSWIAFYELAGWLTLKGLLNQGDKLSSWGGNIFRAQGADIDPTFPCKPPKYQLITKCYFPEDTVGEKLLTWLNEEPRSFLHEHFIFSHPDHAKYEWVMLHGMLRQNKEKDVSVEIKLNTVMITKDNYTLVSDIINNDDDIKYDLVDIDSSVTDYGFWAGEIQWNDTLVSGNVQLRLPDQNIEVFPPMSFNSWDTSLSQMNQLDSFPYLSKNISDQLGLYFKPLNISHYCKDDTLATLFLSDNNSSFFFVRKDLLDKYLKEKSMCLVWTAPHRLDPNPTVLG